MPSRHATLVVPAGVFRFFFQQSGKGFAFVQPFGLDAYDESGARRGWFGFNESHFLDSAVNFSA
jgi:hypothetical protein